MDMEGLKALLRLHIAIGKVLDYTKKGVFYKNYSKYDDQILSLLEEINDLTSEFMFKENSANRKTVNHLNFRVFHGLLGAITEGSELSEHLLHYLETGEIDRVGIAEEFADTDWYKAIEFDELNIDNGVAWFNVIEKLRVRFPDKYSDLDADVRNLEEERKRLEASMDGE